ncbi:hypothetical protein ALC57_18469 [Trachymyrmex cornetzi]|uniref:Uncharacterized protein n=1 Tax=Trachymyrmex cornetzi TaxID=471704 RepID=A0A151IRV6_9HYME|nr:hypothetical protein ALC57_18469 [Trachymyrmex cornetzi]
MILVHTIVDHGDRLRLRSPVFAKVIESDIHERSNELASLAARGVFRVSGGKVSNKKSNEFLGQLSRVRPKEHAAPHHLDRSIVSPAAAERTQTRR